MWIFRTVPFLAGTLVGVCLCQLLSSELLVILILVLLGLPFALLGILFHLGVRDFQGY
jgi:hypothetical protein